MALYHCSFGVVSRGNGGSAVAKAAYNAACKLVEQIFDKATGIYTSVIHDYSRKKGVVYSEILVPEIAQGMFETREDLWNKVQLKEVRKDAQYSRKLTLALPSELSVEENIELLRNYINESFVHEGMIADLSVHMDEENNPHAHVQLTLRNIELNEEGKPSFGLKNISWNRKDMLQTWRTLWAVYVNKELEVRGFHDRISELSHEERGIELTAGIKEGPARYMKSAERRELNAEIQQSNAERIKENPELIIDKLSINKAAFTKVDIAREVGKYFSVKIGKSDTDLENLNQINASEFLSAYERVLASDKLAILTNNSLNGEMLYTSSARIKLEQRLVDTVSKLKEDYSHSLGVTEKDLGEFSFAETVKENIKGVGKAIESTLGVKLGVSKEIELSEKQKQAVLYALNGPSISVIEGLPGAGKSTVVREITRQLVKKGYRVIGGAVSNSASRNLAEVGGIFTKNLSQWRADIEKYERYITGEKFNPTLALDYYEKELYQKRPSYFTNKDVFILDEMSMVSLPELDFIKNEILKAGGKIINLGDNNQLGAITLQGASSKTTEITGSYVLDEVRRQENPLHRKATQLMSRYRLKEALAIYKETKVFETAENREKLREKLVNDYASEYLKVAKGSGVDHLSAQGKMAIIAYTNDEVRALNILVREKLKTAGIIKGESFKLINSRGSLEFGIGEQIIFNRNDKRQGVENGDVGIVRSINGNVLGVELIRDKKSYNINIETKDYKSIDYGYAQTIYKAQGKTYDYVKALFESLTGFQVFNVMMTRHVKDLKCYIDQDMIDSNLHSNVEYKKEEKLTSAILNSIARRAKSDFSIEYLNSDNLPEVKTLKAYIEAKEDVLKLHKEIEREKDKIFKRDGIHINTWESKYADDYKEVLEERKELAQEICKDFDSYKGLISQTRLSFDVIAAHAGLEGYRKEYSINKQKVGVQAASIIVNKAMIDLVNSFKEIAMKEHGPLFEGENEPLRSRIKTLSSKLIHEHEEKVLSIKDLELKINDLRQAKYKAEADITNSKYFVEEALPYIMNKTFKDGEAALKSWNALKEEEGFSGALHVVKRDISVLGKLQGMGIGNLFALSSARQDALSNVKTLPENLKKYEESKVMIQEVTSELKENHWDKEIAATQANIKELESTMLDIKSYELVRNIKVKALDTESLIELAKDKNIQSWIGKIQKANSAMEQKGRSEINTNNKSNENYNNKGISKDFKVERESLSFDEVNAKLTQHAKELGYELLPQITGDKVEEASRGVLKCGSIMLETDGAKAGLWYRFSRGEGGNLFDLIKEANGHSSSVESLKWGAEWLGMSQSNYLAVHDKEANKESEARKPINIKEAGWKTISVVPGNAPVPNIDKCFARLKSSHTHEATYEYKDAKGDNIGYVVRFKDNETGTKQTLPLVWAENIKTTRQGWRSQGFEGKPIYGLEKLSQDRKTVLIVEGDKTADSASQMLPEYTVISWLGGSQSADKVDWSILKGRKVVIWPDCDQPGMKAADVINSKLEGVAQDIAIVNPYILKFAGKVHEGLLPEKWDLADNLPEGIIKEGIKEAIKNAQNAKLELTSENLEAAIDKVRLDDEQLYAQVSKQAKELAATSKLYPDSESLVKKVVSNVKAADGVIKDIGFTASKDALELNDIVKGGALGNKFHESLLSHIYIKEQVEGKELHSSYKLSRAIKGYDKLEKGLTLLQDKKYNDEIKTACDFLVGVQGVSRKAADVFVQAVKDIVLLDTLTTQALHRNFEYFKEVTTQIRDIFIKNKDILMQSSDVLNDTTIKSIYNELLESVVCNDKLIDQPLLKLLNKAKGYQPTYEEIQTKMKDLSISDKEIVSKAYLHALERYEIDGRNALTEKQLEAVCRRAELEAQYKQGWVNHFKLERVSSEGFTAADKILIDVEAERLSKIQGRIAEEKILANEAYDRRQIADMSYASYINRDSKIESELRSNIYLRGVYKDDAELAQHLAIGIVDYKLSYGNNLTTERYLVLKDTAIEQIKLNKQIDSLYSQNYEESTKDILTKNQFSKDLAAAKMYGVHLLNNELNNRALESTVLKDINTQLSKTNKDYLCSYDLIIKQTINYTKQLQQQFVQQRQQDISNQLQRSKGIDLDK
jgi:ATP-dependent exoDNAse (exonuclease V) alpha subunit